LTDPAKEYVQLHAEWYQCKFELETVILKTKFNRKEINRLLALELKLHSRIKDLEFEIEKLNPNFRNPNPNPNSSFQISNPNSEF
jgi:hypothetical protein